MPLNYQDYDALSFDCYGTLIDWESGIWAAFQPLITADPSAGIDRQKVLTEFAKLEHAVQAAHPSMRYPEVLSRVHHQFTLDNDLAMSATLDRAFGDSVGFWPAFPDSTEALRQLKSRYKLIILSNVDDAGFAASNRHLGVDFDAIYTAEQIGTYKPDPANFDFLLKNLKNDHGVVKKKVLHVAQSLYHDHRPAKAAGMDCVWIDRQGLSKGGGWGATAKLEDWPEVDAVFNDLASFAREAMGT